MILKILVILIGLGVGGIREWVIISFDVRVSFKDIIDFLVFLEIVFINGVKIIKFEL